MGEVRRFVVPQDCSTSLIYLKEKIRTIFNLGRSTCKVSWKDEDGDDVTIETDEELLIDLQELNGPVYKLQVIKGSDCFQKLDNLKKPPKITTTRAKCILESLVILAMGLLMDLDTSAWCVLIMAFVGVAKVKEFIPDIT